LKFLTLIRVIRPGGVAVYKRFKKDIQDIFFTALRAVDPYSIIKQCVKLDGNNLIVFDQSHDCKNFNLGKFKRIFIIGAGKAGAPMAQALEELLGDRVIHGIISVKHGYTIKLERVYVREVGHPLPDEAGVKVTKEILTLLREAQENDLILCLISGGGSALLPAPAGGITLDDKRKTTHLLLNCGASIEEINVVRKHISLTKGGRLAEAAYPATIISLILSDVVDDKLDVIASGPTVPDHSSFCGAWIIIRKYSLENKIPESIKKFLKEGVEGKTKETPKPGDEIFCNVYNFIIGNIKVALRTAEAKARELGYGSLILSSSMQGEARQVARVHAGIAKDILSTGNPISPPACLISGGETTVTVIGKGRGGRNQEFSLALALEIQGFRYIVNLAANTDGMDGMTDAAGAIVDDTTIDRATKLGIDPVAFLQNNDSYHFFQRTGELLTTGPTNTNVMDIVLTLVDKR